jgi:hypothetical protein
MIGIVVEDLAFERTQSGSGLPVESRNKWFGRSVWRSRRYGNPVQDFKDEQERVGTGWPPANAGLFGSSTDRAAAMTRKYEETFEQRAAAYW